ncbi:hypothetical protein UPYG_G00157140 [Umbra pygmaea]|uniref:Mitochondrial assembly of ribosomal large subunit protein 1 n=1 Tax=Umbra pygmaea TaxID=75934 RepID=A0ABD0WZP5_UMBPY
MCVLKCSRHFLSQIIQRTVIQMYPVVVRSTRCISKVQRGTGLLYPRYTCLSSPLFSHFSAFHNDVRRLYYSDSHSEDIHSRSESTNLRTQHNAYIIEGDACHKNRHEDFNIDVLVSLLRQENAADICVIKVPEDIKYTNYFIVVSGSSTRHLRAMALYANKVYKFMKKECDPHAKIEGKDAEDWMCIDFGTMVVHFMLPETREVYELEKLWTLRSFDEQLSNIPVETIPKDFVYGAVVTVNK